MTEPGVPAPAPPAHPPAAGIQDIAWKVWPWAAWLLPVALVIRGFVFSETGGWETLLLVVASPVLIPALGLLAMLPRFLLRRRGHRTTPPALVGVLFLHGWSWVTAILALPGSGDSGPRPSALGVLVPVPFSHVAQNAIFGGAAAVAILSWVAVLVLAVVLPVRPPRRGWTVAGMLAALASPVLIVAVVLGGVATTAWQRDAAGDTPVGIAAEPLAVQAERAAARYEDLQVRLEPVRASLAAGGWTWERVGFDRFVRECADRDADCYRFADAAVAEQPPADGARDAVLAVLAEEGWQVDLAVARRIFASDDGYAIEVYLYPDSVQVSATSPIWWGDPYDLGQQLDDSDRGSGPFPAGEWPALG